MILSDAKAFIERLPQIKNASDVGAAFTDFSAPHGFIAAACGGGHDTPTGWSYDFFFNTWPLEWLAQYQKNDFVRHDPGPLLARLTAKPFTFREALAYRKLTDKQIEFKNWLSGLGIHDGLVVPIHYPGGDFGLTGIIADHLMESTEENLALHLASAYAHQHCRDIGSDVTEASSVKAPLTAREIECLRWVVKGKSDTDIGAILEISPTTVHFHIERVKKKLGVKTRTQAAALVVTLGYI